MTEDESKANGTREEPRREKGDGGYGYYRSLAVCLSVYELQSDRLCDRLLPGLKGEKLHRAVCRLLRGRRQRTVTVKDFCGTGQIFLETLLSEGYRRRLALDFTYDRLSPARLSSATFPDLNLTVRVFRRTRFFARRIPMRSFFSRRYLFCNRTAIRFLCREREKLRKILLDQRGMSAKRA